MSDLSYMTTSGYTLDMNKLHLSGQDKDKYVLLNNKDYEYYKKWSWFLSNSGYAKRAKPTFYRQTATKPWYRKYRTIYMHREILQPLSNQEVDHINGDKLDNRRSNLRPATRMDNSHNTQSPGGISKYKGTYFDNRMGRKKWHASITVKGKHMSLKYYLTEKEAAKAYNEAAMKYHGEFARLNNVV